LGELLLVPGTVDKMHESQLQLELQGSQMHVFGFEAVFSPSGCAPHEDLFDYIRASLNASRNLVNPDSINTAASPPRNSLREDKFG
jgi:hypothetical protein